MSATAMTLAGQRQIDWARPSGCPEFFETLKVYAGRAEVAGGAPIEIAVARCARREQVNRDALTKLHALRVNKRATPVVLAVVTDAGEVITFGPNPAAAPVRPLPVEQATRVFQAVLDEPTALLARARLAALSQAIDSTTIPGLKNSGLFANHELRVGVPQRPDWRSSCADSALLLIERGPSLISKLGYSTARAGAHALVLTGKGPRPHAIAVMLDEREAFDSESPRFSISPVAYGLRMAEQHGVSWLIMARGSQLRLYPARIDLGVGRKGLAETFLEVDLPQLTVEHAGYLGLLFSADALAEGGTAFQILGSSAQYAVALGERLRDKVYEEIVPELSVAIAEQLVEQGYEMDAEGLDLAYQVTLRVFFRLLFQVYAEDRNLLPYGENAKYDRNALKTVAKDLVDNPDEEFDPESTSLWDSLAQVWRVIDSGDKAWGVPPYNGGLFTSDPDTNEHGAIIRQLAVTNDVMGPVLRALLLDESDDGEVGPIDFRSLSVREFGTIYEGLLESSLGLAEVDLTLDAKGTWLPAKKKSDEIYAYAGQVYFHNTSGQRKGTGSYFTPSFVVEHLLERSLDPALDEHLAKVAALIGKGDQAGAAELFFDFKVADLAMGSGHFLTAAIDHIEAKMAAFLAEDGHQIPGVARELTLLLQAAKDATGPDAAEPDTSSLLRRQIARRCVYGLDINPIAVELARVSIWIHTFVRGLPMSSLDHNLVCANSLTGIGSVEEALDVLVPGRKGAPTLFDGPIEDALNGARTVLVDVALMPELNRAETQAAAKAIRNARDVAETARLLFDAAVLTRIGRGGLVSELDPDKIARAASTPAAQAALAPLQPAHMPALFPEVFLRPNGGFDVLVGNPPWEAVYTREDKWWSLRSPGLLGLSQKERDARLERLKRERPDLRDEYEALVDALELQRQTLASGPYPGIGSGHVDLYQLFAWRFWQLLASNGWLGVVLPRSALVGSGLRLWRKEVLRVGEFSDIRVLTNSGKWIFAEVDGRYTICLVTARRQSTGVVRLRGPFFSAKEFKAEGDAPAEFSGVELERFTDTLAFPSASSRADGEIMRLMKESPRLDVGAEDFRFAPTRGDLLEKSLFRFDTAPSSGAVPIAAGATFNFWNPDFGPMYAWSPGRTYRAALAKRIETASRNRRSAYYGVTEFSLSNLPIDRARIAVRWIARQTDTRSAIACLLPPGTAATDAASVLLRLRGSVSTEAFLLGILSSIPFDWYVRRWVEMNLTFELLNPCPVPLPDTSDPLRRRVTEIAGRLGAKDERFAEWAKAVGVPVGSVRNQAQQADMEAELDALVSHLYGLARGQVEHIFRTFHRGWDYEPRLEAVLAHFDRIGSPQ